MITETVDYSEKCCEYSGENEHLPAWEVVDPASSEDGALGYERRYPKEDGEEHSRNDGCAKEP